jgi:hypothetical protein
MLPPWGTTLGLHSPWAAALGFLPLCPTAAGIWPHRAVQPTVGATPNAVTLPPWCTTPDVYFSKILIGPFIFQKSRQNKYIKKFHQFEAVTATFDTPQST